MKKVLELPLYILHPIAEVLVRINLAIRTNLGLTANFTWGIAAIMPLVSLVFVPTGNDFPWPTVRRPQCRGPGFRTSLSSESPTPRRPSAGSGGRRSSACARTT
jgi:hypothetical protein